MNNIKLLGLTFANLEINKLVEYIDFKLRFKKKNYNFNCKCCKNNSIKK